MTIRQRAKGAAALEVLENKEILTGKDGKVYTYKREVRCDCGKIVAYRSKDTIYLYCKKCRREIPIKLEPEP